MYYTELGYDEYDQYLAGPEWKAIKNFYYGNCKKHECDICETRERILLHKRSYKFLTLPELKKRYRGDSSKILRYLHTYMVYLCSSCNKKVHFYPDGSKVPLEYRKLRERETTVRKRVPKVKPKPIVRHQKKNFLGAYFQQFIKK
jgi:hypothetical protein